MAEPQNDEAPLNLETVTQDELERPPVCEPGPDEAVEQPLPDMQGPHKARRCANSERELLKFPPPVE